MSHDRIEVGGGAGAAGDGNVVPGRIAWGVGARGSLTGVTVIAGCAKRCGKGGGSARLARHVAAACRRDAASFGLTARAGVALGSSRGLSTGADAVADATGVDGADAASST
jgi:hypothetical protein